MKKKILRNLTLGLGCLMLTLIISTSVLMHNSTTNSNIHVIHPQEESPNS